MDTTTTEYLEELAADALEPGLTPAVRVNRLRNLAEVYADIRDAITSTQFVLSGGAAIDAAAGRKTIIRRDLADLAGAFKFKETIDPAALNTGSSSAFGILHQLATPLTFGMVPGLSDPAATGQVNDSDYSTATFIVDSVVDGRPDTAGAAFPMSQQLVYWTDPEGRKLVDQIVADIVDRAAETYIGNAIAAAATPVTGVHATLADKLDAAEAQASTGAGSVADVLLVNPADWPAIRRAVAASWTNGLPHPEPVLSVGMPAGTACLAATVALIVQADRMQFMQASAPRILGRETVAFRQFRGVVRHAAGVVKITL